jgi:hypothetical protein
MHDFAPFTLQLLGAFNLCQSLKMIVILKSQDTPRSLKIPKELSEAVILKRTEIQWSKDKVRLRNLNPTKNWGRT